MLLFLGVPLAAGIITRYALLATIGKERFEKRFMPYFGPVALLGLIYTIIVMFSLQGHQVSLHLLISNSIAISQRSIRQRRSLSAHAEHGLHTRVYAEVEDACLS